MYIDALINLSYLVGAVAFVWGLRLLSSPDSARRGNILAAIGMGIAIVATFIKPIAGGDNNYIWIIGGMILGAIVGWLAAKRIKMTAMPEMVSVFNGLGGACAVFLAIAELYKYYDGQMVLDASGRGIALFTLLIGGVAFTGSMLAFGKLAGKIKDKHVILPKHSIINIILLITVLVLAVLLVIQGKSSGFGTILIFLLISLVYGFSFVAPIGGADMPVVISLLNSFTGLSAAAAGLIYNNQIMLIGGILVGAAGTILTILMCQAMNRSLGNVIIGGFGSAGGSSSVDTGDQVVRQATPNDAAIQLFYANSVMFVPGYGLAVAQAQKVVKELDDMLEANGVDVKYAIHPVAGRMPGHMNVLLAEADVPYPKLLDLEDANSALPDTDAVVIVGANDVVNPAALDDPGSPIYGMPVLEVWKAKNTIVLKRSMSPGYAGIQNPLFFKENNRMLFGDAKDSLQKIVGEVKSM
ncbi:MAG: NAD(P)(+) transhydrogenase (Re/Si-specific) subunit beta [Saprospiraceae bacterium]|nr:NAD(P)(+) transhydrogenase (Re/Si-specific) subunit beta [Saprospiraceae bacterium]